ncbi:unnamed protein product, partial [Amoebophrya sp. A25]|eukprot:GSA25T00025665001.1
MDDDIVELSTPKRSTSKSSKPKGPTAEQRWNSSTPNARADLLVREGLKIQPNVAGGETLMNKLRKDLKKPMRHRLTYRNAVQIYGKWAEVDSLQKIQNNDNAAERWEKNNKKIDMQLRLLPGGNVEVDNAKSLKAKSKDVDLFNISGVERAKIVKSIIEKLKQTNRLANYLKAVEYLCGHYCTHRQEMRRLSHQSANLLDKEKKELLSLAFLKAFQGVIFQKNTPEDLRTWLDTIDPDVIQFVGLRGWLNLLGYEMGKELKMHEGSPQPNDLPDQEGDIMADIKRRLQAIWSKAVQDEEKKVISVAVRDQALEDDDDHNANHTIEMIAQEKWDTFQIFTALQQITEEADDLEKKYQANMGQKQNRVSLHYMTRERANQLIDGTNNLMEK